MRNPIQAVMISLLILSLGATVFFFTRFRQTSEDYAQMKVAEGEAKASYGRTLEAISQIQDSLNAISIASGNAQLLSQGLKAEQKLNEPQGREALDRIAAVRASIARSKALIHQLESNLTRSGIKVAGLQKMVAGLKQTLAEKESLIGELTMRVDSLQTRVTGLAAEVQAGQETIEEKRQELATVYYIVGTKKELMGAGAVVETGGFLGFGRTLQPSATIDDGVLTALDTDRGTVIRTPSAKVRVLSAQPASSYELRLAEGVMEIHILNPKAFRKIKRLVVLAA